MQSLQERWLALIEKELRDHGLDPVSTFSYSNVGNVRGMRGMVPYIQVQFSFQGYASLSIHGRCLGITTVKNISRLNGKTDTGFPFFAVLPEQGSSVSKYVSFHALYPEDTSRVRAFKDALAHACSRAKALYVDDEDDGGDDLCPGCGASPGEGPRAGCHDEEGCGYEREHGSAPEAPFA